MLRNCLEKNVCLTTAGEFQKIVESRGQKTLKKMVKQHLHHHMLFGRVSRKNDPSSSKNKLQHIQLSDMTGTSNRTGFYGQMKQKKSFLAANTQDGFGTHSDKEVPHVYNKINCCIFYVVALWFCWRS